MKFGVRQCANIVFRAKQNTQIGTSVFKEGQPVLYIDTATTSSMEQATSTNYAQGGRGNARLIAWEGEKTLTFNITDALISPISLAMLSGAGLVKEASKRVHVHAVTKATMKVTQGVGTIDLTEALLSFGKISTTPSDPTDKGLTVDAGKDAPLFIMGIDADGSITGDIVTSTSDIQYSVTTAQADPTKVTSAVLTVTTPKWNNDTAITDPEVNVMIDYYVVKASEKVSEIQVTPGDFAGYYYVEADTLFRQQSSGKDMPANLTFPNVKVQSGFTITMAGSGDPSTFDFVMDAFPGYTYFDKTKQVMCVMQVVEDSDSATTQGHSVMLENANPGEAGDVINNDSDMYDPHVNG